MERPHKVGELEQERPAEPDVVREAAPDPLRMSKGELGSWGEDLAAAHLEQQGLTVLARRWRCREGEIDIVAWAGGRTIVVCEVKTRTGTRYGGPAEAVTRAKRLKLRRLALLFAQQRARGWVPIRFDVVSVLVDPEGVPHLDHRVEAF